MEKSKFNKIKGFEYMSLLFMEWYKDINGLDSISKTQDSFSKLKLIKLHFFACATTAKTGGEDLFDKFNNFYAMPYGHVESDVYKDMSSMKAVEIPSNLRISIKKEINDSYFDEIDDYKNELEEAVLKLKEENKTIVKNTASELVNLSHTWFSWKATYDMARMLNRNSMKINVEMIRKEDKFYQPFNVFECI